MTSPNNSILKSATKTIGLDSTKYTSINNGTTFQNTSKTFNNDFKISKIDLAYKNACSLIDELICAVQQKKQLSRMGIKNVGDTNEYILDLCQNDDQLFCQYEQDNAQKRAQMRQELSQIDLEKLELFKIIENQRQQNQNLSRRCSKLENQNNYFKQSCVSTKMYQTGSKNCQQNQTYRTAVTYRSPPSSLAQSNLFAQLQMLKQQNQYLRQQTIRMLAQQQ